MRRDETIERHIAALTTDFIAQILDYLQKQKATNANKFVQNQLDEYQQKHNLTDLERSDVDYQIKYELAKKNKPELFEIKGKPVEVFPIDRNSKMVLLKKEDKTHVVAYQKKGMQPHIIGKGRTKDDALKSVFGSSKYNIIRNNTVFDVGNGKALSLKSNRDIRLLGLQDKKPDIKLENPDVVRNSILKSSLENNPTEHKLLIERSLEKVGIDKQELHKNDYPLPNIKHDDDPMTIHKEMTTFFTRIRDNEKLNKFAEAFKRDGYSFLQGFLGFYGVELQDRLAEKKQDFELVRSDKGTSINRMNANGDIKRLSPYFTQKEAEKQLNSLNEFMTERKQERTRNQELQQEQVLEINIENSGGSKNE
ncbi:hypothetical protein ACTOS9_21845 (plasmid) [Bacillus subtilis]